MKRGDVVEVDWPFSADFREAKVTLNLDKARRD